MGCGGFPAVKIIHSLAVTLMVILTKISKAFWRGRTLRTLYEDQLLWAVQKVLAAKLISLSKMGSTSKNDRRFSPAHYSTPNGGVTQEPKNLQKASLTWSLKC